jgi:hypothetical protein
LALQIKSGAAPRRKEGDVGLLYENLDERTRRLMLDEMNLDITDNKLSISPYFSGQGVHDYPNLLRQAIESGDDNSLAAALSEQGRILRSYTRHTPSHGYSIVTIPANAAEVVAESEFNRYYIRALARRAIEDGLQELIVIRAKAVTEPRPQSEALVETALNPRDVLEDLRQHPGEPSRLGVPGGPGSGLSVRLP